MRRKTVLFITDSMADVAVVMQVLAALDVDVAGSSCAQARAAANHFSTCDLVIFDQVGVSSDTAARIEELLSESYEGAILFIVEHGRLGEFRLPFSRTADFVVQGATPEEYTARICQLLWPGSETGSADYLTIDNMSINFATYQVKVNGEPLDFTYLEYALLAFLVTHPGRTYSRDALLSRVWGFDYYGGSRTVDVHIRRVRAKLGPELSQHLETVRGVGYLWNA